jgi:hypothetical protein
VGKGESVRDEGRRMKDEEVLRSSFLVPRFAR